MEKYKRMTKEQTKHEKREKKCLAKYKYDSEWIIDNWDEYRTFQDMWEDYCVKVGYIPMGTLKSHCRNVLHLKRHGHYFTKEEIEWLEENYPEMGAELATDGFNKKFCKHKTLNSIKTYVSKIGLTVTEERQKVVDRDIQNRKEIGEVVYRKGIPFIKQDDGSWIPKKYIVAGMPKKNEIVVNLDGDKENCSIENLMIIHRRISAKMSINKFWSENRDITKTGILACQLEDALNRKMGEK